MKSRILAAALALMLLTGCGVPQPSPSPMPSATLAPTATPAITASPAPIVIATPTPTPAPPLLVGGSQTSIFAAAAYRPLAIRLYQRATGATEIEADAAIELYFTALVDSSMHYADERLHIAAQLPGESGTYIPHMSSLRSIFPNEKLESIPIALDALVILVSDNNSVESVTEGQLKGILMGEIVNWKEVGGADIPVKPYEPMYSSWTRAALTSVVGLDEYTVPNAGIFYDGGNSTYGDIIDFADAGVLAATTYAYATLQYRQTGYKMLAIDGVAPSAETIAERSYMYTANVCAVINSSASQNASARTVYEFLETDESRTLIEESGYILEKL